MQTSYSLSQSPCAPGMLADNGPKDIINGTSAAIQKIGLLLSLGASVGLVKSPTAATDITATPKGILFSSHDQECTSEASPSVLAKKPLNIIKKGRVWVAVEDKANFALEGAVHVRFAGVGSAGAFRCAAVALETAILPSAKFVEIQGDYALIDLNLV